METSCNNQKMLGGRQCELSRGDTSFVLSSAGFTDLPNELQEEIQKTVNKKLTISLAEYDAKDKGVDYEDEEEDIDVNWNWEDVTGITCDATGSNFEDESLVDFMDSYLKGFQRCHNLQHLDLTEAEFPEDDEETMQVLYESMKAWPRLVSLETPITGGNGMDDMRIWGKILSENTQLKKLTFNLYVDAPELEELKTNLTTSHVTHLTVDSSIGMDFEARKVFVDILEKFPDLQSFKSDRRIDLDGLILLLRVLRKLKSLTHLDLSKNVFGEEEWKTIAFFLTLGDWESLKVIKMGFAPSQNARQTVTEAIRSSGRNISVK